MPDTYRAIFVSDVHMSNSLPHAQPSSRGRTDRLDDQLALWRRIFDAARSEKAKAIYVLGDLFDTSRLDAVTLAETVNILFETPVPMFILGGNHDAVNTRGERFVVEAFSQFDRISYICEGSPPAPLPSWLSMWPVEYAPLEDTRESIRLARLARRGGVNVLLLHQSILDCKHGSWVCDHGLAPDEVREGFDVALAGHFHDPQTFGADQKGLYLGAPMHLRFDDVGRAACFWSVTFHEGGNMDANPIDGGCPSFWTTDETVAPDEARPGDYIRLVVEASPAELEARRGEIDSFIGDLKHKGFRATWKQKPKHHHAERLVSYEVGETLSFTSLLSGYVDAEDVNTDGLDPAELKSLGRTLLEDTDAA